MRILFASTHPHLPEVRGGLQTTTHDLCLAIRDIGGEAAVLCGVLDGDSAPADPSAWRVDDTLGYRVMRAAIPERALARAAVAWNASAIVVQSGPRLRALLIAGLDTGRPTAAYLHNVELHQIEGALVPDPAVLYLANSAFSARRWNALCGIDCRVIPPVVRLADPPLESAGDRVLFVNPVPVKGVERLFALAAACPELPFLVVENWYLYPSWRDYGKRRAAALGNVEWIEPTGDMQAVYARTRVLLMPSVWEEAYGRTVVEAQARAIPVLASDRGALPEVVGPGGIVLDAHADNGEWAAALRRLYSDPAPWAAQARGHAAAHLVATPVIAADLLAALFEHGLRLAQTSEAVPPEQRLLEAGRAAQARGAYDEAIESYGDGWRQAPDAETARTLALHLARLQADTGRWDDAMATLARAIEAHPPATLLRVDRCWLRRAGGDRGVALREARDLVERHADCPQAWFVLGVLLDEDEDRAAAAQAYEKTLALDPAHVEAMCRLAAFLRIRGQRTEAKRWVDAALATPPEGAEAVAALVQLLFDEGRFDDARRKAVQGLRRADASPALRRLLAAIHVRRGQARLAMRWAASALRLSPHDPESLRIGAWVAHEAGDRATAFDLARRLSEHGQAGVWALATAAAVLEAGGALPEAERCAERAVAAHPRAAEAWRVLASVRRSQGRLADAELAARRALAISEGADAWRLLGTILLQQGRAAFARLAHWRALEWSPEDADAWLGMAMARARSGDAPGALQAVAEAQTQAQRADWELAAELRAQVLCEGGADTAFDPAIATDECLALLRRDAASRAGLDLALRLLGLGRDVDAVLDVAPIGARREAFRRAVANAIHRCGQEPLRRLSAAAEAAFPDDAWFATAAFYASAIGGATAEDLPWRARQWNRGFRIRVACKSITSPAPSVPGSRPRLAYVASQSHGRLLHRVLRSHDPGEVDVFLYAHEPWPDAPAWVQVRPLLPGALVESCAADGIDVAIDTGGVQPFEGQFEVLAAYARRVAPVQAGWIGTVAPSGGFFDALIADAVSIPAGTDADYEERIVRIAGGQWCWDPPVDAPDPGTPAFERAGVLTFGVSARSLRLGEAAIAAFARIVAATRDSRIRFAGSISEDWPLQRAVRATMARHGIDAARVQFDPWRPRDGHWSWLGEIDVLLDPLPSGSGLGIPDALWMGVPAVTLAGSGPGSRQAASILDALGRHEWIATDLDGYVATASRLAADPEALREARAGLRDELLRSPLVDGRRVASGIEAFCRQVKPHCDAIRGTRDAKAAARLHAAWELDGWLERAAAIRLPAPAADQVPDLSVVIVLYNQAGLTRRALQSLADQQGPSFETVIIDNASSDRTRDLLARVRGARVVHHASNIGFLRAANAGAARTRGRHLLFLNNDTILHPGALAAACEALDADASLGAVGARVVLGDGGLQEAGNRVFRDGSTLGIGRTEDPFSPAALAPRSTDFCSGAFLATPRATWDRLGGFDEAYAPAYFEDADYCLRAWQAGLRVLYEPRVLIEHLEWGSAVQGEAAKLLVQNRALFVRRHAAFLEGQPAVRRERLDGDRWRSPEDRPRRPRVLVLDNEVPHMARGGGLPRARLMLQALDGWPATLLPLWTVDDDLSAVHASIPRSIEVALGVGLHGLEGFLERRLGVYDTLLVSRPPNLEAIGPLRRRRPELFDGLRLVYDAEAVFAVREIAQAATRGRPLAPEAARARIAREVALARDASAVLVVSAADEAIFRAAGATTHLLAHATEVRHDVPGLAARQGMLFVGALHPGTPNEDGLLWFLDEVLPRLAHLPAAARQVTVVGRCTSERVARRAGEGVRIAGPLASLVPAYDAARVFIAPARFAAGVPIKVIEAASGGIPVVASAVLAEQLGWRREGTIFGARDADGFARGVEKLLLDDEAWRRQQAAALAECRARYDFEEFARTLRAALAEPA